MKAFGKWIDSKWFDTPMILMRRECRSEGKSSMKRVNLEGCRGGTNASDIGMYPK